jgi:REP element-mobilizing transposase RayT
MRNTMVREKSRNSLRLAGYDYSQPGAYFITLVVFRREQIFRKIENSEIKLSPAGKIVYQVWRSLPTRYPQIEIGSAVIMPDHFHGVIEVKSAAVAAIHELPQLGEIRLSRRRMTIPLVVGYFKMNVAKKVNKLFGTPGRPLWQRNYYEHVIRNEKEYDRIQLYIDANISNWKEKPDDDDWDIDKF